MKQNTKYYSICFLHGILIVLIALLPNYWKIIPSITTYVLICISVYNSIFHYNTQRGKN